MGVKHMQGVPAHIEYIKTVPKSKKNINCKFCEDGTCYNTISTKFSEGCYSKKGCMYSIPVSNSAGKSQSVKNFNKKYLMSPMLSVYFVESLIRKYFYRNLTEEIKINNKSYKIKTSYNIPKDILTVNILYKNINHKFNFKYNLKLKEVIRIVGNEVVFNVKLSSLINETSKVNKKLGELIKKNNSNNITRKAYIDSNEEIIRKRDSLIMYTSYIITRELLKLYK